MKRSALIVALLVAVALGAVSCRKKATSTTGKPAARPADSKESYKPLPPPPTPTLLPGEKRLPELGE